MLLPESVSVLLPFWATAPLPLMAPPRVWPAEPLVIEQGAEADGEIPAITTARTQRTPTADLQRSGGDRRGAGVGVGGIEHEQARACLRKGTRAADAGLC